MSGRGWGGWGEKRDSRSFVVRGAENWEGMEAVWSDRSDDDLGTGCSARSMSSLSEDWISASVEPLLKRLLLS